MAFNTLCIERRKDGIATLTLNRADKHNAMSGEMLDELRRAALELGRDNAVRVVILTGAGTSFCAGGDLSWMHAQFEAGRAEREAESIRLGFMLKALNELPKPLIGRINGPAYGGGMGLISVCDVAIAADSAKFGFTETRLGLIPANIGPFVVARMGEGNARRVFMSSRLFGAAEARELGLVARVAPPRELDAAVDEEAHPYLACAPKAVAAAKALTRKLGPVIDEETLRHTAGLLADCWEGEAKEGVAAFFEKRKPQWQG
jgi:methylglutaconyl-CoA hydratase